jgi:mannose/fructose/N-acetylgalactosamine-specific phosphotransferase system component IID
MRFNPTIFSVIRAVDRVMDKRKRSYRISVKLTLDEKEAVERRAKALGMSFSGLLRENAINPQRSTEEILAREWVSVALQLRKMQSESSEKQQLQEILEQLKPLIARTISR